MGSIYLITGLMASGKSTVSELLAKRFQRGVHLRGDVFRKMVVSGREEMTENPSEEALRQLHLRYRLAAESAKMYADAGFTVVLQDNYYCEALPQMVEMLKPHQPKVVVLAPDVQTICHREETRGKRGYTGFSVESLYEVFMAETPRIGLWLDTSSLTPDETVEAIVTHF